MSFTDGAANLLLDDPDAVAPSPPDPAGDGAGPTSPGPASPTLVPTGAVSVSAPPAGVYGPEHWAAADAVSSELMPTLSAALQTPPGLLSKDRIVGDAARMLASVRAGGALSDEQFDQVMAGAAGFLGGVPDGPDEQARRDALLRLGAGHLAARGRLAAMTDFTPSPGGAPANDGGGDAGDEPSSGDSDASPSPEGAQGDSGAPAVVSVADAPSGGTSTEAGFPGADAPTEDGGGVGGAQAVDPEDGGAPPTSADPEDPQGQGAAAPLTRARQAFGPAPGSRPSWLDQHHRGFIRTSSPSAVAPAAPGLGARGLANAAKGFGEVAALPGLVVFGSAAMMKMTAAEARSMVGDTIKRFKLDPNKVADVQAARAYVWASQFAGQMSRAPWTGPGLEATAQAVMRLEQAKPDTLYRAYHHDPAAIVLVKMVADAAADGERYERLRPPGLIRPLQSSNAVARSILRLNPRDRMQAHHLVALNTWKTYLYLQTIAARAGWQVDSPENLIALPADFATQASLARFGVNLPVHNSAHPVYDAATLMKIQIQLNSLGHPPTPRQARDILEHTALLNRIDLVERLWHPILR